MSRFLHLGLALILLVSLLMAALALPVMAQGGTVLAVDPAQASVEVNGQREIHLLVTGAENLNAFDVQVEYDSALLSLTKWEFGDLLSNLAVVKRDDLPGSFRLVATQLATPGVSGDGVLLKLTFSGKLTGSSAITITKAEFARSEGGLSLPELEHGTMTIIPAQPTATPTRTPTATATLAPSQTLTLTPTRTATPPAGGPNPTGAAPSNTPGSGGGLPLLTEAPEPTKQPREELPTWAVTEPLAGTLTVEQLVDPLVLAPGAEKTRQAGHYATLMAQVAQMTAVSAGLNAPAARAGNASISTLLLGAVLAAGALVLGILVVLIIRRKKTRQEGNHEE